MSDWHRRGGIGAALRLGGLCLLGLAWLAIARAYALSHGGSHRSAIPGEYLLAAAAFLCASGGAALAVIGAHVFDRIQLAPRWRQPSVSPAAENASPDPPSR